jgi:hypothetical protein
VHELVKIKYNNYDMHGDKIKIKDIWLCIGDRICSYAVLNEYQYNNDLSMD